uniref:Uncharacterized protein n=1 Tax=Panagrolaimus davidi TaxID=227884 RepID=A0A914P0T8_9BILA
MANPNSHKWERYTLIGQDELMEPSKNMQLYSLNHCTSIQHPADGGIKALPVNNNGEPLIQNLSSSYNEANILEVVPSQNSSQYQNYLFSANAVNTQSSTTALPPIDSFNLNKNISRNLEYI